MEYFRRDAEAYIEGVYLKRVSRKPPRWMCENEHGVKFVLEKGDKGKPRSWTVLLPEGGFISLDTRLKAIRLMSELQRIKDEENDTHSSPVL